jgi:tetratricopeptide (TPR) repeat protein
MKKSMPFIIILIFIFTLNSFAQDIFVEYIEGIIEVKINNRWQEVMIGDSLSPTNTIRLQEESFAELIADDVLVTISTEGTYKLKDLLNASNEVAAWDINSYLQTTVASIGEEKDEKSRTAAMGIRAAKVEDEVHWLGGDDSASLLVDGRKYLEKGRYEEALLAFEDALQIVSFEKENVFLFYIAYTYAAMNQKATAMSYLREIDFDPDEPFFPELVILQGKLWIASLSFQRALDLFDTYLDHHNQGTEVQTVHFLSYFCYKGLDNNNRARQSLKTAFAMDPNSDIGKAAEKLLLN